MEKAAPYRRAFHRRVRLGAEHGSIDASLPTTPCSAYGFNWPPSDYTDDEPRQIGVQMAHRR